MNDTTRTLLIVDDVDAVRKALALILEDEGYNILQATNGIEALKQIADNHIDLMITDILMPEMDGIELVIEARKSFPELKIILISGGGRQIANDGDYDYLSQTTKLTGITHVLKKPFDPEDIINLIAKLLDE